MTAPPGFGSRSIPLAGAVDHSRPAGDARSNRIDDGETLPAIPLRGAVVDVYVRHPALDVEAVAPAIDGVHTAQDTAVRARHYRYTMAPFALGPCVPPQIADNCPAGDGAVPGLDGQNDVPAEPGGMQPDGDAGLKGDPSARHVDDEA